ncbi:HDOD domain-containing protein [Undibacterium sp. RuTC16W]|uniref:HDOD domain-containing protein n=1 Tax=Undibacterium sp. RuTC16W TaxID=3413048 RepID=UPI003BEFB6FA
MNQTGHISLEAIATKIQRLPALSSIVTELLTSMEKDDVDIGSVVTKISHDQTLTAKALRLANSSFYGMQHQITSIQEAITVLGFRSIQTLVTTTAIISSFRENHASIFDFTVFWRHSIASAICAQEIARFVEMSPDKAFTACLLHDIGKLVLITVYQEQYTQVLERQKQSDTSLFLLENEMLGIDHAAVGSALASYWKFPEEIQHAIACHHAPENHQQLAMILHVADAIAHALDLTHSHDEAVPEINEFAWQQLGLTPQTCKKIFCRTEMQCEEICAILIA